MAGDEVAIRLRLRDAARFASQADRAARSIRGIGQSAGLTRRESRALQTTLGGIGSAFSTVGRYARIAGGAAVTGLAAGAVAGVKFNASMEQNEVAFSQFLGSTDKARAYLGDLYDIAKKTPFEFPELTGAARKFLAFGFSAEKTKDILATVGDTVAGLGGGSEELDRLTMAFGQIQAKGKLSTEELMQMAEMGVPAFKILKKELGLTGSELEKQLRDGSIDAKTGIAALKEGLDDTFGGASAKQAKTFTGQISTLKDTFTQILGQATKPLFDYLSKTALPALSNLATKAQEFIKGGGLARVFKQIAPVAMKAFGAVKGVVMDFLDALKPAEPFFRNVLLPLLKGFGMGILASIVGAFKVAIPVIRIVATALGWIGTKLAPLRGAFEIIGGVVGFFAAGPLLKIIAGLGKLGRFLGFVRGSFTAASGVIRVAIGAIGRFVGQVGRAIGFVGRLGGTLGRGLVSGIRTALSAVKSIGGKVLEVGKSIARNILKGITSVFARGVGFAASVGTALKNFLNDHTPLGDKVHAGPISFTLPKLHSGGLVPGVGDTPRMLQGGEYVVRRKVVDQLGPTFFKSLNSGASPTAVTRGSGGGGLIRVHVDQPIYLDGREIGRNVARRTENDTLRRR